MDWIKADSIKPPEGLDVLVIIDSYGLRRKSIAAWIPKHSSLAENFMSEDWDPDDSDWEDGTEYVPEGWWEHPGCGDQSWQVDTSVTHWMYLPGFPKEE